MHLTKIIIMAFLHMKIIIIVSGHLMHIKKIIIIAFNATKEDKYHTFNATKEDNYHCI